MLMTPEAPQHDWMAIGQAVGVFIVGVLAAWNKISQVKTAKTVEATADKVSDLNDQAAENAKKLEENSEDTRFTRQMVDKIHGLTNGTMTAAKRTIAELTSAKALISKNPTDQAAAEDAMNDYLKYVTAQLAINTPMPNRPVNQPPTPQPSTPPPA
jgi:hypothetical protein